MVVTQLNIIADESSGNIKAGAVVAYRRTNTGQWEDPWGGLFDEEEQVQMDRLARSDTAHVRLSAGTKHERFFAAHLAAKF